MFIYDKKLQYPVKIDTPNPKLAAIIISQYGGPDGELGASLRYLSQRYSMPFDELKGLLTDIGTEELGHLEMVGTLVYQLSDGATGKDWLNGHTPEYYADNGNAVFPQNAQGSPFNAAAIASTGDPITNLFEDLAADGAITQGQQNY